MEMKSAANDNASLGVGTSRAKKARKSTATVKRKEPAKYPAKDEDDLCGIEIYEVLGNVQEDGNEGAGCSPQLQSPSEACKKFGDCEESIVVGNEVLLRIMNHKETPKRNKDDDLLNLACIFDGSGNPKSQNSGSGKDLALIGKSKEDEIRLGASALKNSIALRGPSKSVESRNAGFMLGIQLDIEEIQECECVFPGDETMPSLYPPPKKLKDVNSTEVKRERLANEVKAIEAAPGEKVDVMVAESSETNNDLLETEGNTENQKDGDVQDSDITAGQVEMMEHCNGDEELVVSSGCAWGTEVRPRSKLYCSAGKNDDNEEEDEDEDFIGELKINEAGSLEFVKRYKGETVGENGTAVEIRGGKLAEKSEEEDKGAVQDKEIGSLMEEGAVKEGGKRKRIRKGGGTKKLNLKKRKTEKCKNHKPSDHSDDEGESKGKSNMEKGAKKDSVKSTSKICDQTTLEETIDRVASGHLSLPFIENLRGEIKTLSRGDLEELIVQKLCEVITERSAVGHLRKRAEALERNQERWREKVLSLTKQIKEMDMVMKNYLSEVRRHQTEKSFQMVAPLRVTRSVGLQVSFTSTPSKLSKMMPKGSGDAHHILDNEVKHHSQRTVHITQTPNKKISLLPSTVVKSKSLVVDQKDKMSPKSGVTITLQPASSSSEAQAATKAVQVQPKLSILPAIEASSTSLIDLTDDDDRQAQDSCPDTSLQTVTVGPASKVKVVNHIQPAESPSGGVTFLISNAASPPCCSSSSSSDEPLSRQLIIATSSSQTTQRHVLPAIPPLLYKANSLIQPGSQQQQAGSNQSRISALAKLLKHPAPLPQPPSNQIQKPNWKMLPPRPSLKISKGDTGIVLSWNMPLGPEYEPIVSYQLFAYQESESPPCSSLWKRVGDIKALRLPMACTLTQFLTGNKYYFAVRAVDMHSRVGPFSFPSSIALIR